MIPLRDPLVTCPLNARERVAFDTMKARAGIGSDTDVVRLGLVHLARHLDVVLHQTDFHQRGYCRLTRRRDRT